MSTMQKITRELQPSPLEMKANGDENINVNRHD
jgi:hypothetical protein